jgi:hypothetical protein
VTAGNWPLRPTLARWLADKPHLDPRRRVPANPEPVPNKLRHNNKEETMLEGFTTEPFTRPPEEITLIPQSFAFAYLGHQDEQQAFALRVTDSKVGEVAVVLTEAGAMHVAEHLLAMIADQDTLRAEWDARNRKAS